MPSRRLMGAILSIANDPAPLMHDESLPPLYRAVNPALYAHLRRVAAGLLGAVAHGQTLQPTALVHEAFLKLARAEAAVVDDPSHLVSLSVRAMRQVIVDAARRKGAKKRGAKPVRVTLTGLGNEGEASIVDLIALDGFLQELAELDSRQVRLVELRCFGGYSMSEIAELLGCSLATTERCWRQARAWLKMRLMESA